MAGPTGHRRSFADKLNRLFATKTRRNGTEYKNQHVADAIKEAGGSISSSYIWALRQGTRDDPGFKHIQQLADFFGVPAAYFFDDEVTDRVDAQLAELRREQQRLNELAADSEVQLMALRAGELSPNRRQLVNELLKVVYREEQAEREGKRPDR